MVSSTHKGLHGRMAVIENALALTLSRTFSLAKNCKYSAMYNLKTYNLKHVIKMDMKKCFHCRLIEVSGY